MKTLAWGKPKITFAKLNATEEVEGEWLSLPAPKEGTTKLTPSVVQEAKEEGGGTVAILRKYDLEFTLFLTKEDNIPLEADANDNVDGLFAVKIESYTEGAIKAQIDKVSFSIEKSYSPADGWVATYKGNCMPPKSGAIVKLSK